MKKNQKCSRNFYIKKIKIKKRNVQKFEEKKIFQESTQVFKN
jgi:hypothetical protein